MRTVLVLMLLMIAGVSLASETDPFPYGRWQIGLDIQHNQLGDDQSRDEISFESEAPGAGIHVGVMVARRLMLRLHATESNHPTNEPDVSIRYAGVSIDLLYMFREDQVLRPYIFGGLGGYDLQSIQDNLTFDTVGGAMTFGIGGYWWMSQSFSLHSQARVEAINWLNTTAVLDRPDGSTVTTETLIQDSGVAGSLSLGVAYWF